MRERLQMRDQCMEAVRSLGGKVTNSEGFDPETTHVVTGMLSHIDDYDLSSE